MSRIAALILAAGTSTRFGKPKQLALFRGESLIRHAATVALAAGCDHVAVIAGEHASEIQTELAGLACDVVTNHTWREGLASSIHAGLEHLLTDDHDIEHILLLACDQPLVKAENLRELMALRKAEDKTIVASAYAGTLGIPALFARTCFASLLQLTGDHGAKELILARPEDVVTFPFPAAAHDIDTAADYQGLTSDAAAD